MDTRSLQRIASGVLAPVTLALALLLTVPPPPAPGTGGESPVRTIVQARDLAAARAAVERVGGVVSHELGIIAAVAARLTPEQLAALRAHGPELRLFADRDLRCTGGNGKKSSDSTDGGGTNGNTAWYTPPVPYTVYPQFVGADRLHRKGITGAGVTVAVLDSGLAPYSGLLVNSQGKSRLLAHYDAIGNRLFGQEPTDSNGHGGHVTSVALNSEVPDSSTLFNGIAPDADLVVVRAFDYEGRGSYADVIRGLDWIVANRAAYGIRVLNLSFSAPPRSYYWDDPLNQAVMRAWQAGIAVVVSAGNTGPDAMTIGVPGNVPYVITVGAMTDSYTPDDPGDDRLAYFSSAGPTAEGFVKPEMIAPGGHMRALMNILSKTAFEHPEFHDGGWYFMMSGTSQAAAVVTGIVALAFDKSPSLTPDEVKCRLLGAAAPAVDASGALAYSVFQQGAGLVDAYDTVFGNSRKCANQGLDIDADLAGTQHFAGPARMADDGTYYIEGLEGYAWNGAYAWGGGYAWNNAYAWNGGYAWNNADGWNDAYAWNNGEAQTTAYAWNNSLNESVAVNRWVEQE